mmetsp:Transcript_34/g.64  ORF Transcript_34/g.64 Transcript_34/m.64 type:complete len:252 (-) Transcript_34:1177-1932(-)
MLARGRHVGWDGWLFGGQHIKNCLKSEHQVLCLMAVEVPKAWPVGLKADDSPRALPKLKGVFHKRRRKILRGTVGRGIICTAPVAAQLDVLVAWVARRAQVARALVEEAGRVPPRQQEAIGFIKAAPRSKVRNVDHLERHAVHVQRVCGRREILNHNLHHLCRLGDVYDGCSLSATLAFGHVKWRAWQPVRARRHLIGRVHVPSPPLKRVVGGGAVCWTQQSEVDSVTYIGLLGLGLQYSRAGDAIAVRFR